MDIINSIISDIGSRIEKVVDAQGVDQVSQLNATSHGGVTITQIEDAKPVESKTKFSIKSLISYCVTKSHLTRKEIASLGILGLVKFLPTNYLVLASTAIILWNMPKEQVKIETK